MQARFADVGEELPAPPSEAKEVHMKDPDGNVFALSTGSWLAQRKHP